MKKKVWIYASVLLFISLLLSGCTKSPAENIKSVGVVQTAESSQPEGFPVKNIEFFLPVPAGGLIDVAMRSLADVIDFGNPVVIINRPGGGQTMGLSEVYLKSQDPHVITSAGFAGFIIQPHLIDVSYSIDDFRYIAINHPPEPQIIISRAGSEYQTWQNVRDALIAGSVVSYSAPNSEGLGRIAMFEIMSQEDIRPEFIPYTGSAEGFSALRHGLIDLYIIDASVAIPNIKMKNFIGLMILGPNRLTKIPSVPSAEELGIQNMEKFVGYTTIAVSKKTPDEIVKWIKLKIDKAQQSEAYINYLSTVVDAEEPLKYYTEKEITEMVYSSYEAIVENMDKFGLTGK